VLTAGYPILLSTLSASGRDREGQSTFNDRDSETGTLNIYGVVEVCKRRKVDKRLFGSMVLVLRVAETPRGEI
jgi:hypothetical protein